MSASDSMLPTSEDINEVAESILKGGTRYHSEKIAVVSGYVLIVLLSLLWAFSGVEIGTGMHAEFEAQTIQNLRDQNFVLKNPSSTAWHDVRLVLNDQYLAKVDKVEADARHQLKPTDFRYYFHVPRPWGQKSWEQAATRAKPSSTAPGDVEIRNLEIRTREGKVDVTVSTDG